MFEVITMLNANCLAMSNNSLLTSSLIDQKHGAAACKGGATCRDTAFPAISVGEAAVFFVPSDKDLFNYILT